MKPQNADSSTVTVMLVRQSAGYVVLCRGALNPWMWFLRHCLSPRSWGVHHNWGVCLLDVVQVANYLEFSAEDNESDRKKALSDVVDLGQDVWVKVGGVL